MSDQVWIALISNIFTPITLAILTGLSVRGNSRIKRVQTQVENSHVKPDGTLINLREENDERHTEITKSLDVINSKTTNINRRVDMLESTMYDLLTAMPKWIKKRVNHV